MKINAGMMSSSNDEWTTPRWLFDRLDSVFHFTLDAAASPGNALCAKYHIWPDGLCDWTGERVFVNPPYSDIKAWAEHFTEQAGKAQLIVALVPARVDTRWFQEHVAKADLVRFVKGRLRFGEAKNSAPFPSALAFWFGLDAMLQRPARRVNPSKSTGLEISGSGSPDHPA